MEIIILVELSILPLTVIRIRICVDQIDVPLNISTPAGVKCHKKDNKSYIFGFTMSIFQKSVIMTGL